MTLSVYVVSGNTIAREGLSAIIVAKGFTIVQSAGAVSELVLDHARDDLAIIDDVSPEIQLAAVKAIVAVSSSMRPVVLASVFDFETMAECFREGAEGYLIKDMEVHALSAALHLIAAGQKVMPSTFADQLPRPREPLSHGSGLSGERTMDEANLSQRERDVLCCVMGGYPNKVIARQLKVSEATIKVHVKAILRKLKVMNRTQAALWAHGQGMSNGSAEPDGDIEPHLMAAPLSVAKNRTGAAAGSGAAMWN